MQGGFERKHVFNLAMLAAALVGRGDIEEATAAAGQAAGAGRGIASARMSGELRQLATRLAPHKQLSAVVTVLRALSTGPSGIRALPSGR
jgi:hypothetical protein